MKAGANDYFLKGQLARLVPAIPRELNEARGLQEREKAAAEMKVLKKRKLYYKDIMEELRAMNKVSR